MSKASSSKNPFIQSTQGYWAPIIRLLLSAAIAASIIAIDLDFFDAYLHDIRVRILPSPDPSGHVEIIRVQPSTVEFFGNQPDMSQHTELVRMLRESGARHILYVAQPDTIEHSPESAAQFSELAAATEGFFVITQDVRIKEQTDSRRLPAPFENVPSFSGPRTADNNIFANDGVSRRALYSYDDQLLLHAHVAASYSPEIREPDEVNGLWAFGPSKQVFINFAPKGALPTTAFEDVLTGKVPASKYQEKTVLIGVDLELNGKNYVYTPFDRSLKELFPVIELHANMIETFIRNDAITPSPKWLSFILTLLVALLSTWVVLALRPGTGLLTLVAALGAFALICIFAFWPFGLWIKMAHPLLAVFVAYYFFIPYRLIVENRRSWEYYQKNKLLTQVEELKSNFISMMSHDLKTPLARIRGMADVIRADSNDLSSTQTDAIGTITQSAEDLTSLINSILNFGRIESEKIKLHLQSKDVNAILTEVVKKQHYFAQAKKIEIIEEYEPLFSINVDVELIRQVFTNLVENAVKYSPDETKVLVTTEEVDGFIEVQVSDQGMGIPPDEVDQVFMKFFRSKNAKTSPIKGSGLGLYLAKYFVELHGGSIEVDSEVGNGTTFTVSLPV